LFPAEKGSGPYIRGQRPVQGQPSPARPGAQGHRWPEDSPLSPQESLLLVPSRLPTFPRLHLEPEEWRQAWKRGDLESRSGGWLTWRIPARRSRCWQRGAGIAPWWRPFVITNPGRVLESMRSAQRLICHPKDIFLNPDAPAVPPCTLISPWDIHMLG
jgi:hypothetical protein